VRSFPQDQAHASLSTVFLFAEHTLLGLRFSCGASTRLSTFGFPSPHAHASRPTVFPVGAAHASPSTVFLFAEHTLVRAQFSFLPYTRLTSNSFPSWRAHAQPSTVFLYDSHTLGTWQFSFQRYARSRSDGFPRPQTHARCLLHALYTMWFSLHACTRSPVHSFP